MVPLPLAAGPSTAIRIRSGAWFSFSCSFKPGALTALHAYGKAPAARYQACFQTCRTEPETGVKLTMVKPEWGAKRTCPKCSTRFYDLGKADPVHCIECGNEWVPEPVLKSKQPLPFEPAAPVAKEPVADAELEAEELAIAEDEEPSADDEVDLTTGDDDLGVETAPDEDES
jgi:uncharacterized protein (TIGR02300 family)